MKRRELDWQDILFGFTDHVWNSVVVATDDVVAPVVCTTVLNPTSQFSGGFPDHGSKVVVGGLGVPVVGLAFAVPPVNGVFTTGSTEVQVFPVWATRVFQVTGSTVEVVSIVLSVLL